MLFAVACGTDASYVQVAVSTTSFGMKRENTMYFSEAQEELHKVELHVESSKLLCEATSGFPSLDPSGPGGLGEF